jgi:hypothetical protein
MQTSGPEAGRHACQPCVPVRRKARSKLRSTSWMDAGPVWPLMRRMRPMFAAWERVGEGVMVWPAETPVARSSRSKWSSSCRRTVSTTSACRSRRVGLQPGSLFLARPLRAWRLISCCPFHGLADSQAAAWKMCLRTLVKQRQPQAALARALSRMLASAKPSVPCDVVVRQHLPLACRHRWTGPRDVGTRELRCPHTPRASPGA